MKELRDHDPKDQLKMIQFVLNDRLKILKTCLKTSKKDEFGYVDGYDAQMENEILFLETLLDTIEKE